MNLIKLSEIKTEDVDLISNKTKHNYINLKSTNSEDVIDCVHSFLCKYGIWKVSDKIIRSIKPANYVPPEKYHDISFILIFYRLACQTKIEKEKMLFLQEKEMEKAALEKDNSNLTNIETSNSINPKQSIVVRRLDNPNINHTLNTQHIYPHMHQYPQHPPHPSLPFIPLENKFALAQPKETKKSIEKIIIDDYDSDADASSLCEIVNELDSSNDSDDNSNLESNTKSETIILDKNQKAQKANQVNQVNQVNKVKKIKKSKKETDSYSDSSTDIESALNTDDLDEIAVALEESNYSESVDSEVSETETETESESKTSSGSDFSDSEVEIDMHVKKIQKKKETPKKQTSKKINKPQAKITPPKKEIVKEVVKEVVKESTKTLPTAKTAKTAQSTQTPKKKPVKNLLSKITNIQNKKQPVKKTFTTNTGSKSNNKKSKKNSKK